DHSRTVLLSPSLHDALPISSLMRDFATEPPFSELPFASFLLADNLNDLHPQVAFNPRAARVHVPLPDVAMLTRALAQLRVDHPADRKSTRLNSSHVKISYAV